jgi:hypothetical protein
LSGHWKKTITDKVIDDYYRILKAYPDSSIIEATFAYMEAGIDRFPTPGVFKKHIPLRREDSLKEVNFTSDLPIEERRQRFKDLQHYVKTKEKAGWMEG